MIIEFEMLGVPTNWSNMIRNRFYMYAKKKEWLDAAEILGRVARVKAGVPIAEKGHPIRILHIHQYRQRLLDKDGLYVSCKPIIDGLKTVLKRKIDGKMVTVSGAGLIYNDDPSHIDWEASQSKCIRDEQKTKIRIEIQS